MPVLLAIVACEKIIIDEQRNPSLIVLMERVEAQVPQGQEMPQNVLAPQEWGIFTLWMKKDEEAPLHCKQVIEMFPPGASSEARKQRIETEFDFVDTLHKVSNKIVGIPVGTAGTCWIHVRLESEAGTTETVSYPIEIAHKFVPLEAFPQVVKSETAKQ